MHMKMHYAISKTIYTIYQIYQYATFSNLQLHPQHMSFNSDQPSPKFAHLSKLQYHLQWPTHTIIFHIIMSLVNTLKSCISLSIHLIHQLKSFSNFSINFTKISSCGLINEHEQFNLNHSPKHILSQNILRILFMGVLFTCHYSCVTIHVSLFN